jgi:hypothetical protein
VVVDDADHDLVVGDGLADHLEITGAKGARHERDRVGVDLIECG